MQWITVDETGHVPGIAATLPTGHEVLLDACNQVADMRPIQQEQADKSTQPLEEQGTITEDE